MAVPRAVILLLALAALVFLPCAVALLVIFLGDRKSHSDRRASDLRRLGRLRLGLATRNTMWHEAVRQAYDDRLRLACRGLGIEQHLAELDGLDLEIERVRVEGELRRTGLFFGASETDRRQDHGQDRR